MKRDICAYALLFALSLTIAGCGTLNTSRGTGSRSTGAGVEGQADRDFERLVNQGKLKIAGPRPAASAITLDGGGTAHFYVFDMGQADSMLVIGPEPARKTLLIDTGELNWNTQKGCERVHKRVKELTGKTHVDYFVLTHYHMDHVGSPRTVAANGRVTPGGGLFCLLDNGKQFFSIGTLIDPGDGEAAFQPTRQKSHAAILDSLDDWVASGTLQKRVPADFSPQLIDLGPGVKVEVVTAGGKAFDGDPGALAKTAQANPGLYRVGLEASPNDFSVGLEISVGNFELFTAGDLSGSPGNPPYPLYIENGHGQVYTNVESHLVAHWNSVGRESNVEVYRANHHGSANSSTVDLATALKPELVIYSCGGKYGHPDPSIANRFEALEADQMVTTSVDDASWDDFVFPDRYGSGWDNPTGEIEIHVPVGGEFFEVRTAAQAFEYPILSDAQEATQ